VPNKQMVDTIVDNISLRSHRKAEIRIEVGLDATSSQLLQLIKEVRSILLLNPVEGIAVYLVDTGKNAHVVNIEYLSFVTQPMEEFLQQRQDIIFNIISLMEDLKIQMAAAATDVIVTNKSIG
ncbi:MAG: mechanosensitive ion channel, partial [Sediminibacterium sp.]|nr:mechanosensitive ion channel [Sediminibacterium sp.]